MCKHGRRLLGSPIILRGKRNSILVKLIPFVARQSSFFYLLTLRRMLFLSILAIRAPVAVVYDGGGVYFGGASSFAVTAPLVSSEIVAGMACIGRSFRVSA